ncbi:MAG: cobalamin-dependent protein [Fibrobacteria bacterium]|nr:cobalamin-dependent protein [Fibrobacteria bacterium]
MNILLIRPQPSSETIGLQHVMICEPLELEYASAIVAHPDVTVTILDMILESKPLEYFLEKYSPDLVGMTAYITHVNIVKEYARRIKTMLPDCKVAVGGVHAEVVPQDFECEQLDFILHNDSLAVFKEIAERIREGNSTDKKDLPGVWHRDGGPLVKPTAFTAPHPDRDKVERYRHRYYYIFHNPCALIKTSYGCPFQCRFCFCREITGHHYFTRPLDDVIAEIKTIPEREIYIVDDNFLVKRDRVLEFCRLLKEHKLDKRFLIYGRADFIAHNPDVIAEFSTCGLRAVIVGLESATAEELQAYNKQSSINVNEQSIKILHDNAVECYGTFILGQNWDSSDFTKLIKWLKKNKMLFVNLQPFTPLPGTALYEEYCDKLIVPRNDFEKWDLAHLVIKPGKISFRSYYWNMIRAYYSVTMHPLSIWKLLRRYGLKENFKLSIGSTRITLQYVKKWILGR